MVLQIKASNDVGMGIQADLTTQDDLFVAKGVTVGSTDSDTVSGTGNGHSVHIEGTVTSSMRAVRLGDSLTDANQQLFVAEGGKVYGLGIQPTVVLLGVNSQVENRGTIFGEVALLVGGDNASATSKVLNSGVIEGSNSAINRNSFMTDNVELINTGQILSDQHAYVSSSVGKDLITNNGFMKGKIALGGGDDLYDGRAGTVTGSVSGEAGVDTILGGALAETLAGGNDADTVDGGGGNDALDGGAGGDTVIGGAGNDVLNGSGGADTMRGGADNDTYVVSEAADIVSESGGSGIDLVQSLISFNLAPSARVIGAIENLSLANVAAALNGTGNTLNNQITGNSFANVLSGQNGNDKLIGLGGNDTLVGGLGVDVLQGGAGDDKLNGGLGKDTLTGGANKDTFIFNNAPGLANRDLVTDFSHADDTFQLENAVFAKLGAPGALNAAFFCAGTKALDANDYVVYNKATGVLSYDADGNGAGAALQIAVLSNKAALQANDFVVI